MDGLPHGNVLGERERAVLDFEAGWWLHSAERSKAEAIRDTLGISPATFYALLDSLIDEPDAQKSHPLVIARLRRRRSTRRRRRFFGDEPARRRP